MMNINWKEIIIMSAEVAIVAVLGEFAALQTISWASIGALGITFLVKLGQEVARNIELNSNTAGMKKGKLKYNTLFLKRYE